MSKVRRWLRSSRLLTWAIERIIEFKIPDDLIVKLGLVYLQSGGSKKSYDAVLKKTVQTVKLNDNLAEVQLSKSAVIKAPIGKEKGVIVVGFEHELNKLLHHSAFQEICDQYNILFMPTWQPFYSVELLRFLKLRPDAITVLPSSWQCYFNSINNPGLIKVLPFHASSWIDETIYQPETKTIDILMVANFSIYKRHHLLFSALKELPENLNVLLVGRQLKDRTADDLLAEADTYGVKHRFKLIESPSDDEVRNYLCQAKLVLGLSGREGSYVSLAEALFAGAAVAVFSDAYIGSKNYINPHTGFLLDSEKSLAVQIKTCLQLAQTLTPREWAIQNISTQFNNVRLNALLKHKAESNGELWTKECDAFRIQSFQFEPMSGAWSSEVNNAVQHLYNNGVKLKVQL